MVITLSAMGLCLAHSLNKATWGRGEVGKAHAGLLSWLKIHEHQIVGQVHDADVSAAMVKVVSSREWPAGPVDLLGHLF
jgi:hypothetical protein